MRTWLAETSRLLTSRTKVIRIARGQWEQLDGYQVDQTGQYPRQYQGHMLINAQFATLTPLEPRLVRKLLPPLTSIIRTTTARSLLYECINGIIQGGILDSSDDSVGGEEIANLCVSKLRGMIMVEGDANCKSSIFVTSLLTRPSKIRCLTRVQQDRPHPRLPCCSAGRCHYGMHRQSRHLHPTAGSRFSGGNGQQR